MSSFQSHSVEACAVNGYAHVTIMHVCFIRTRCTSEQLWSNEVVVTGTWNRASQNWYFVTLRVTASHVKGRATPLHRGPVSAWRVEMIITESMLSVSSQSCHKISYPWSLWWVRVMLPRALLFTSGCFRSFWVQAVQHVSSAWTRGVEFSSQGNPCRACSLKSLWLSTKAGYAQLIHALLFPGTPPCAC